MKRRDMLAALGTTGFVIAGGAASVIAFDKPSDEGRAKCDWSKFPDLVGKVEHMLGHSFGYIPPASGDPLHLALRDVPTLTKLAFNSKTDSYIPLPGPVELESVHYYTNGKFDHLRLVSRGGDAATRDHVVTIDIGGAPGRGRGPKHFQMWVVIQSREMVVGVAQISGEYEGTFPARSD